MDAKYITTASGEPIQSWLTIYTIRLSFISYKDVVKVKVVIKSFISAKNKYGHPNKMFRFPSPDRPIFFRKVKQKKSRLATV